MKCSKCNNLIPDESVFCPFCGKKGEGARGQSIGEPKSYENPNTDQNEARRPGLWEKRKDTVIKVLICVCVLIVVLLGYEIYEVKWEAEQIAIGNEQFTAHNSLNKQEGIERQGAAAAINEIETTYSSSSEQTISVSANDNSEENIDFESLNVGDSFFLGHNYGERIEWVVLDINDSRVLLLSKKLLCAMKFHNSYSSVTWENSLIRKWLNGEFLQEAFDQKEQDLIQETNVEVEKNPYFSSKSSATTTDKLFLLSIQEEEKYKILEDDNSLWWLRTPGSDQGYNEAIHNYYFGHPVNDTCGVRPAMWISIE